MALTVAQLQQLTAARLDDAEALYTAGRYDAAAYLAGYAVEVALKIAIQYWYNQGQMKKHRWLSKNG